MPALDVAICSDALLLIGAGTISSFDEGTDKATVAGNLYPGIRDGLLSSYPWRFATKKVQLARETAAPIGEWRYSFKLPPEKLQLRAIFDSPAVDAKPLRRYELFENQVYANAPELWADIIFNPGEARFPAYFVQLLKYVLAADFAMPLTDQASLAEYYDRKAYGLPSENRIGGQMGIARRLDAQQQPPQVIEDFSLIEARFS